MRIVKSSIWNELMIELRSAFFTALNYYESELLCLDGDIEVDWVKFKIHWKVISSSQFFH